MGRDVFLGEGPVLQNAKVPEKPLEQTFSTGWEVGGNTNPETQQQDRNLPLDGRQDGHADDMLGIYFG